jgi:uncharacterized membrane protein
MAEQIKRRRSAPKRALIGPLVMLASGMVAGVMLWRFLMLDEPAPAGGRATVAERLSQHDREALERLLGSHGARR